MPTVIDALTVSLGLDPSGFISGTKTAHGATIKFGAATRAAYEQMEKEVEKELKEIGKEQAKAAAEAEKQAKKMARAQDSATESIERLARNALKLFAIFTAGRAVGDFVSQITSADSALGRLATRIGQAPSDISALATAVGRAGGSVDAAQGSFQRFSDSIQELKTTGNTGILPFLYKVQAAGGKQINLNKGISATFHDLADNLKVINDTQGSATANYMGKQLGLDEGTVALMVKGGDAYDAAIEKSKRLGIATKADTEAAQNLQTSIRTLTQASEGLGRTIMTAVTPIIVSLLKPLEEWILKNRAWIATKIEEKVREFADYLRKIDWEAVGKGIRDFAISANAAAKAVGGWTTVVEGLFALWLGSKFLGVLRAIGLLRLALTGGKLTGGLISALGILGTAGIAAILGTSVATDKGVANADKPGVITRSDDENTGAADAGGMWGAIKRAGRGLRRMFGGGSAGSSEGRDDGIHRRARQSVLGRAQQNANSSAVMEEFKKAGLPAEGVAALMGSAQTESSFNPRAHNNVDGGHTGLLQWDKNRWPKIKSWIEGQGGDPYSASWQARAAVAEGRAKPGDALYDHPRTERGWKALEGSAGNLGKAMDGIRDIERYGAGEEGSRGAHARAWLPHVNGTATAQGTPAGVTDISKQAAYSNGQLDGVKGFVVHHTGGRGTPESVVGTLNQRGLGVQYVMDRDGKVYQTLPPGARGAHIRPAQNGSGLSNANSLGMEVIAKNDRDVTPAQVAAAKQFIGQMQKQYPGMQVYGHGELNAHKQEDEGKTIADAVRRASEGAPVATAPAATKPTAWNGIPNAAAFVAQAQAAQVVTASSSANDNRSIVNHDTRFNGPITVHTAATDADGIARDMKGALKKRSFAMGANYGQA